MEQIHTIADAHTKPILSLNFNPYRREIYTGGEDAIIRVWEGESGKLLNSLTEHTGWITSLLFCKELKVLFSASIDGLIIVWGPNGKPLQKIPTGSPIYCLAYNSRRQQLLAGYNKKVRLFQTIANEENHPVSDILERKSVSCSEHSDVVSCMISCEGRFYSAGYDRKIVIYDVPHHGDLKLKVSNTITNAHDAAISCMVFGKDADNNWLITGSFDRIVKLWSLDGNLLQRFDGFSDTITSICYVLPTQTLWIASNSSSPIVFDPRSGINVSDFVRTDDTEFKNVSFALKGLLYVPEMSQVVGVTNRRSIVIWKHNPAASVTVLPGHTDVVECLTFTTKEPLLIFSGGSDGVIRKWERLQLNTFMYSQEALILPKEEKLEEGHLMDSLSRNPDERRHKQAALYRRVNEKLNSWRRGLEEELRVGENQVELMSDDALRSYKRKQLKLKSLLDGEKTSQSAKDNAVVGKGKTSNRPGVLSLYYYEELDVLASGYEDSKIRIWGYNEEVVKDLPPDGDNDKDVNDSNGFSNDSVTNRVSGMVLKHTFNDHKDAVSGIACFLKDGNHWMLSTGWDRRICVFDMKNFRLHDIFRSNQKGSGKEELAADGIILDLEYCHERNEFGYASADKSAYIRKFSPRGDEMLLQAVLLGHEAEVTKIKWNKKYQQWVTGSEDRTIRIWASEGLPLIKIINNDGPVSGLSVDAINGCIITGSQDRCMRVFDPEKKDEVVQKNVGHTDEVRAIIHIPIRNQYVSAAWDNTVRVWNAYLKKGQKRVAGKTTSNFQAAPIVNSSDENEELSPDTDSLSGLKPSTKAVSGKDGAQVLSPLTEDASKQLEEELKGTLGDLESALVGDGKRKKIK